MMTTQWTELTIKSITSSVQEFGGIVHGNDSTGAIDVEFPNVLRAVQFAYAVEADFGWTADLRNGYALDSIHSEPVVLTVRN